MLNKQGVLSDSNVYKSNLINMLHDAHDVEKDDNSWPMTDATSKLLINQECGTHADCTNSCNHLVESNDGNVDSIEEDPSKANSDEHVPKYPIHQNDSHSIFVYVLPCA